MMWSDLWKYWFGLKWSKLLYFQKQLKNFSLRNWRCLWNFSNCQLSLAFQNPFNITSTAHQKHTSFVLVNFGRTWNEMNWSDLWKWQFELKWSKELPFQDVFFLKWRWQVFELQLKWCSLLTQVIQVCNCSKYSQTTLFSKKILLFNCNSKTCQRHFNKNHLESEVLYFTSAQISHFSSFHFKFYQSLPKRMKCDFEVILP